MAWAVSVRPETVAGRSLACGTAPLMRRLLAAVAAAVLCACTVAPLMPATSRPDEAYAGTGQRLARIAVSQGNAVLDALLMKASAGGYVDIRYLGLDSLGRAVFERRDSPPAGARLQPRDPDPAATAADSATPGAMAPPAAVPSDTHVNLIALDLRLNRQLHIQGRTIEVLDATASGLVYRLYQP